MKVGIMSMQRIINYGSFLQAYGLKKTIENLGHTVEFVDYKVGEPLVKEVSVSSNESKFKKLMKVLFSSKYRKMRNAQVTENQAFSNFYYKFENEWLPNLEVSKDKNISPKLDALVIGSDEVFNCTQSNPNVGYSPQLFGFENNADKLISYAASFGSTTLEKLKKYDKDKEIADYLSKFDAISVRDNNSHSIVKQLIGKDPIDSIDPVLLYDFHKEMENININLKDYVVVYAYSGRINEDEAKEIQRFAHSKGKKTLSVGVRQAFTDLYVMADPFTLLAYIKNADYVMTDTFHGTVFSIKYQIPFGTIIRDSNSEKLQDLLNKFSLEDRRITDISNIDSVMDKELNKIDVKEKLGNYQDLAGEYLKNNI